MKRFQLLSVALIALFAFGALTAASSFATFLLAEWLFNGSPVTTALLVESSGTLFLEDNKVFGLKARVECKGILDGFVEAESKDLITEVLTSAGVGTSVVPLVEPALACTNVTNCPEPLVWAVKLPWQTEVELQEEGGNFFLVLILGTPGYQIVCMGTGITDECTAPEAAFELTLEGANLLALFSEPITALAGYKLGTCALGGAESGIVEGEGTIKDAETGELTASSDGITS